MCKMRLHIVVVSLLYLGSCLLVEVSTKEIEFTGKSPNKFDFKPKRTGTTDYKEATTSIRLDFKTIHPNGLLLYRQGAAADGDFLLLELAHGAVRCTGMFKGEPFDIDYFKGYHSNDNRWHSVKVDVTGREIMLHFDSHRSPAVQLTPTGYVQELTTKNSSIFLGMAQPKITDRNNYTGCMRNVRFVSSDYNPPEQSSNCRQKEYYPVQFQSSWSFLKFNVTNPLQHEGGSFRASFTFRTFKSRGGIFSVVAISLKFCLRLDSGRLLCEVTSGRNTTILVLGSNLNDGEWHSVHATLNGTTEKLEVSLDVKKVELDYPPLKVFKKTSQLNISLGKDGEEPGFGGCMFNLQLNSHRYHSHEIRKMNSNDTKFSSCELNNPCFPNPCKNDGKCAHEGKDPMCTCTTEFEGKKCEDSIFKTTCKVYMEQGLTTNASCSLGTDKESRYLAQCEIRDQMMYTIVQPTNKATNLKVSAAKSGKLHADDFYVHEIYSSYYFKPGRIKRLKEDSKACNQILIFSSSICGDESFPNKHAFWKYTVDNKPQKKLPASGRDCHTTFNGCTNCTFNLTNKNELPLTSLWFRKKHNSSHFTVGPLECWGSPDKTMKAALRKDNKRLEAVCDKNSIPTSTPTTSTTKKYVNDTPSVESGCYNSVKPTSGPCINYSLTTIDPSGNPSSVGKAASGKQTGSTAEYGLPAALTALLSSLLVVVLLIAVKFGLPRFIVCLRAQSKSGEYVVSNSHTGRCKHEFIETGTSMGIKKSYWV